MATKGRPTRYTPELAKTICSRIADGESVRSIDKDPKMPSGATIYNWLLDEDKKDFLEQYARARNAQAELLFEELLEIADNGTNDYVADSYVKGDTPGFHVDQENINRSRLRVDTRKWYLSKVLPKKFGDKLDVTSGNEPFKPLLVQFLDGKDNGNTRGV